MVQSISSSHQAHSAQNAPESSKKASKSDHLMYLGMMALIEGVVNSESIGVSLADLSQTLNETVVQNGVNEIKKLQKELSSLSQIEQNWGKYQDYFSSYKKYLSSYQNWKNELSHAHALEHSKHLRDREKGRKLVRKLSGHPPQSPTAPSGAPKSLSKYMDMMSQYGSLSNFRSYVNGVSQQINSENNTVENSKQIPDALQQQVRQMVNNESQYASEVTSFLRVMKDQFRYS